MGEEIVVKVKPSSGRSEIVVEKGKITAYLRARPEGGKANEELLRLAEKFFGKPVKILKGWKSRKKTLLIG